MVDVMDEWMSLWWWSNGWCDGWVDVTMVMGITLCYMHPLCQFCAKWVRTSDPVIRSHAGVDVVMLMVVDVMVCMSSWWLWRFDSDDLVEGRIMWMPRLRYRWNIAIILWHIQLLTHQQTYCIHHMDTFLPPPWVTNWCSFCTWQCPVAYRISVREGRTYTLHKTYYVSGKSRSLIYCGPDRMADLKVNMGVCFCEIRSSLMTL